MLARSKWSNKDLNLSSLSADLSTNRSFIGQFGFSPVSAKSLDMNRIDLEDN
jgi:hypothetical protein